MKQTLIVSNRGQLTLPANLRRRFGIRDGGAVILEERGNELILTQIERFPTPSPYPSRQGRGCTE